LEAVSIVGLFTLNFVDPYVELFSFIVNDLINQYHRGTKLSSPHLFFETIQRPLWRRVFRHILPEGELSSALT